ncbi:MAG: LysR family transcriptional regulator [Rhodospirillaceae bacterium]|nr:LysR family transcriptional regulator [Rhodospirillaceae bacterium]
MNAPHLNGLDLNLVRVFDALIEERNVTRAGHRLGLTQSAVSHALRRLRAILGDELFVRAPEGMRPTPRALEVAPRLREALHLLQNALAPAEFEPAATSRRFVLAANDYVSAVLLPGLTARLREAAPHAALRVRPGSLGIAEALDSGRLDLAIGRFGRVPERYASEPLFRETVVWALSRDHPLADGPLTLDRLAGLPHLILSALGDEVPTVDGFVVEHGLEIRVMRDDASAFQSALAARGLPRMIALTIPHALAAPWIVGRSDVAALLPRRLATVFEGPCRLKLFDPPYPSPPFEWMALWHKGRGDQPAMAWFRRLLREVAESL